MTATTQTDKPPDTPLEGALLHDPRYANGLNPESTDAIRRLREQIAQGKEWGLALLEAAGMWTQAVEERNGRLYVYLVGDEAFDWLLLAERLCSEIEDMVPLADQEDLLFHGKLPQDPADGELEKLLGLTKFRAYTNYWYGVVVEEALQLAVEQEVQKENRSRGRGASQEPQTEDTAWLRLYNDTATDLLRTFRQQKGRLQEDSISLTEKKEFTYWLFKRRVGAWDPARVASDTRKALDCLHLIRDRERTAS